MSHEHIIILSKSQSFHFSAGLESPVQLGWSVNTADDKVLDLPIKNTEWLIITSNILRIVLTNVHNLDMKEKFENISPSPHILWIYGNSC